MQDGTWSDLPPLITARSDCGLAQRVRLSRSIDSDGAMSPDAGGAHCVSVLYCASLELTVWMLENQLAAAAAAGIALPRTLRWSVLNTRLLHCVWLGLASPGNRVGVDFVGGREFGGRGWARWRGGAVHHRGAAGRGRRQLRKRVVRSISLCRTHARTHALTHRS